METFLSQAKVAGSNIQQHFTEDLASTQTMPHCNTGILHCTAKVYSIINRIIDLFTSAYKRAVASKCDLVRTKFMLSSSLISTVPSATTTAHHTVSSSTLHDDDRLFSQADTVRDIQLGHLA